jgi:hypothetical protein
VKLPKPRNRIPEKSVECSQNGSPYLVFQSLEHTSFSVQKQFNRSAAYFVQNNSSGMNAGFWDEVQIQGTKCKNLRYSAQIKPFLAGN